MSSKGSPQTDVAVVGAGPAGLAAAAVAAESGARVRLIDSGGRPGGQIWRHGDQYPAPRVARAWMRRFQLSGAEWTPHTTVVDIPAPGVLHVARNGKGGMITARSVVIATGARELFLPFPGWTRPNVMGAGGAQALLKGGLNVRGRRVVVSGSGPLLLPVAAAMRDAGASVVCVAEQVSAARLLRFSAGLWRSPAKLALAARYGARIPVGRYRPGTWVARADGEMGVETVTLTDGRRKWTERCDLVCCSYGLVPSTELAQLAGCRVARGRVVVDERQQTTVEGVFSAGEATGVAGDQAALVEGEIAGLAAAGALTRAKARRLRGLQSAARRFANELEVAFLPRREVLELALPDTIVCRCEDVDFGQLDRRWTGRQAKLYSRVGMGPCQGAVCGGAVERIFGWEAPSARPPLFGPPLGAWMTDADVE